MPTHFCPEPFEYIEVIANGDVYLCCNGRQRAPIGNAIETPLSALWQSRKAEQIRASIVDNTFTNCGPCAYLDHKGGRVVPFSSLSLTQRSKFMKTPFSEPFMSGLSVNRPPPRKLWLLLDRSCQLACPSCRSGFINGMPFPPTQKLLLQTILSDLPNLRPETLWLDGAGEATFSELYREHFWPHTHLLPANQQIGLLTNGQNFARWAARQTNDAQIRITRIRVSVDAAYAPTYEMNRAPGKWQALCKSLETIATLKGNRFIDEFRIIMAVQANNWREMNDFVIFAADLGAQAWFTQLTNWGTYSDEEYARRAVHLPAHPEHKEFRAMLEASPLLKQPHVINYIMPPVAEDTFGGNPSTNFFAQQDALEIQAEKKRQP